MASEPRKDETDTLIRASFGGIFIDVMNTRDSAQRAIALHSYPFTDGADVEDLGAGERRISMTLVFNGKLYQKHLEGFLKAVAKAGAQELIHPVFGSINAQYVGGEIVHEAEQPEYCEFRAEFVESLVGAPSFSKFTPHYKLGDLGANIGAAQLAAAKGLANSMAKLKPKTLRDYIREMNGSLNKAKSFARNFGASAVADLGLSGLLEPLSFANDMKLIFMARINSILGPLRVLASAFGGGNSAGNSGSAGSVIGGGLSGVGSATLKPYAPSGATTGWGTPAALLRQPLFADKTIVPAPLLVHVQQQTALAVALLVQGIFEIELETPSMTPQDIEAVTNDVRTELQAAILATQAAYPLLVDARPMTEALKAVAARVQATGVALIQARPPLISRAAPTNMNLHLLAHHWYGDFARADEILRLNPPIKNPNFVAQGAVVYGYAD